MLGTFINAGTVLLGSLLGLLLKNRLNERISGVITQIISLCVMLIGLQSCIGYSDTLCIIICLVLGTLIGEAIKIEARLEKLGDFLKRKLVKDDSESRFSEGFVTATILYCVGAMAILGSIEAGLKNDYSIMISKSVLDGITSITLASALGIGVAFSAIPILLYQGAITLLATQLSSVFTSDSPSILAMSAVGGVIIFGIGLNMLDVTKKKIPIGNTLPAIFLPFLYLPVSTFLTGLFGF